MLREQVAAVVESALARTRPGKAFTLAVLAVLPAAAPQAAAAAVAAGAAEASLASKGAAAASMAGAVAGPLLGVAGAYLGAKASIENTRSPRERQFMVRMTWIAVAFCVVFAAVELLGLLFLPRVFANLPAQLAVAGAYTVLLVVFILRSNRRQRQIQIEDGTYVDPRILPRADLADLAPRAIYSSLAGGVFGPLCWIPIMSFIARDYLVALVTIAFGLVVYALSVRAARSAPRQFFRIEMAADRRGGRLDGGPRQLEMGAVDGGLSANVGVRTPVRPAPLGHERAARGRLPVRVPEVCPARPAAAGSAVRAEELQTSAKPGSRRQRL